MVLFAWRLFVEEGTGRMEGSFLEGKLKRENLRRSWKQVTVQMLKEFSLDGVSNRGASEFLRDTVSKVVWLILTKVAWLEALNEPHWCFHGKFKREFLGNETSPTWKNRDGRQSCWKMEELAGITESQVKTKWHFLKISQRNSHRLCDFLNEIGWLTK